MSYFAQHMQMVISIGLILCAAAVAILCEYLRRNNQHLREVAIELQARCEESERISQSFMQLQTELQAQNRQAMQQQVKALPAHAVTAEAPAQTSLRRRPLQGGRRRTEVRRELSPAALAVIGRGIEMANNPALMLRRQEVFADALPEESIERTPALGPMLVRELVEVEVELVTVAAEEAHVADSSAAPKKNWGALLAKRVA